jgi:hypothetical protein
MPCVWLASSWLASGGIMGVMPMPVKIIRPCVALSNDDAKVPKPEGTTVAYLGHLPRGNVLVEWKGQKLLVHPGATDIKK